MKKNGKKYRKLQKELEVKRSVNKKAIHICKHYTGYPAGVGKDICHTTIIAHKGKRFVCQKCKKEFTRDEYLKMLDIMEHLNQNKDNLTEKDLKKIMDERLEAVRYRCMVEKDKSEIVEKIAGSVIGTEYIIEFKKIEDVLAEENKQREYLIGVGEVTNGRLKGSEVVVLNNRTFILESQTNLLLECNDKNILSDMDKNKSKSVKAIVGTLHFINGDCCDITVVLNSDSKLISKWISTIESDNICTFAHWKLRYMLIKQRYALTESEEAECMRIAKKYLGEDYMNDDEKEKNEYERKRKERIKEYVKKIAEKQKAEHLNQDEERSE